MSTKEMIYVTRASMPPFEEYCDAIRPLWDTRSITNMGKYHKEFEQEIAAFLGVPYTSLMVNGHMALEMTIQSFDFPAGSEVITTPYTFISTTHAIVRNGLIPVFCDINEDDLTINTDKIEELITEKTVAIVPVHVYGNVCDVEKIEKIAFKYRLKVIYDACHAFGESYAGKGIGNYGDASVFSFHATKVFNSIEGGAATFHNYEIYEKLYNLKNFGIRDEETIVDVGANAKMNEFAAIMGLCNLKYVSSNIELRKEKIGLYNSILADEKNVSQVISEDSDLVRNYGYYPVLLKNEEIRNRVYETLRKNGYYARKYFYPLTSDASCFRRKYASDNLPVARDASGRVLVLPLFPELENEEIIKITNIVIENS